MLCWLGIIRDISQNNHLQLFQYCHDILTLLLAPRIGLDHQDVLTLDPRTAVFGASPTPPRDPCMPRHGPTLTRRDSGASPNAPRVRISSQFSIFSAYIHTYNYISLFTIHRTDTKVWFWSSMCTHTISFIKVQFILQIYIFDISFLCDLIQE